MIDFNKLELNLQQYKSKYIGNNPFDHVIIDGFCIDKDLSDTVEHLESLELMPHQKSKDYIFARNKFENSDFHRISAGFARLKKDLISERFSIWISQLTGQNVFIDPDFHGGGLHQGGKNSFLDMHADFNYHPINTAWFRNINILLYLNKCWKPEYGGQLKLIDDRIACSQPLLIEPLFNRAVIMLTRDFTLHGYDSINFPKGTFRKSVAAYAYTNTGEAGELRTTRWKPENNMLKRYFSKYIPKLVSLKNRFLGSGTVKNK